MFCLQCGNKLPEDAIFCNRCGTNVRPSDSGLRGQSPPGRITRQFGDGTPSSGADWSQSQPTVQAFPPPQSSGANWLQSQTVLPGAQTWQPPVGNWSQSQPAGTAWSQPSPMMPAPASAQSLPASVMQRLLIHIFKPSLAGNALLGVLLGSILAIVLGVLISDLLLAVAHAITPQTVYLPFTGKNSEDSVNYVLGIISLHSSFRDSLQLFLVMHGATQHTQYVSGSGMQFLMHPTLRRTQAHL